MSYLRGSLNYVWCTTSVLGKGATGAVYQGVNKHNGEPVAVKTFNQVSHLRPPEVQMREFEVLKKVKHENIVKLLSIEEEVDGRGKVIVMELCTGGSLFNILDDPENTYGLEEGEFLLVLAHLSAGMKHLRDLNMVHRDLKPGNIMKFVAPDGSAIYKLTDFGAARELDDDQQFMSLYGTEEYLHPDMYERAVLRKPVGKTFTASVDLWSIGVTLFHVATGQLPFRPFGGRKNKETMHYITTEKASGVISGIQTSENGPIEWSRDFPESCLLSRGLQSHVTSLLGGLMEVDPSKMWTFDKFFTEVTKLLARKAIRVFCLNTMSRITVYLDPQLESYDDFRRLIQVQARVTPEAQILLRNGMLIDGTDGQWLGWVVGTSSSRVVRLPSFTPKIPELEAVAMFDKGNNNVKCTATTTAATGRLPKFPSFPTVISVENDATVAKGACSVSHAIKRVIEEIKEAQLRSFEAVDWFEKVVTERTRELKVRCEEGLALAKSLKQRLAMARSAAGAVFPLVAASGKAAKSDHVDDLCSQLDDLVTDKTATCTTVEHQLAGVCASVAALHRRVVEESSLRRQWNEALEDAEKELVQAAASAAANQSTPSSRSPHSGQAQVEPKEYDAGKAASKAGTYVTKLRESWQHLLRDRAARNLTYNDEQFHMLEKIKMQETSKLLQNLLNHECVPVLTHVADALADWFKAAQVNFVQIQVLEKDLSVALDATKALCSSLDLAQERFQSGLSVVSSRVALSLSKTTESPAQKKKKSTSTVTLNSSTPDVDIPAASSRRSSHRHGKTSTKTTNKDSMKNVVNRLNEMYVTQSELWDILQENNELIAEFCEVTARLAGVDHQPPPPPPALPQPPVLLIEEEEEDDEENEGIVPNV